MSLLTGPPGSVAGCVRGGGVHQPDARAEHEEQAARDRHQEDCQHKEESTDIVMSCNGKVKAATLLLWNVHGEADLTAERWRQIHTKKRARMQKMLPTMCTPVATAKTLSEICVSTGSVIRTVSPAPSKGTM